MPSRISVLLRAMMFSPIFGSDLVEMNDLYGF